MPQAEGVGPKGVTQMRYILAVIFVCAIDVPVAPALPAVGPASLSAAREDSVVQVVRRRPHSNRHSRREDGIHPLVGSGDY